LDNVPYNTVDITPANMSAFKEKFFLIFNMAVGGNWPGNPDGTTIFPQKMYVDYVRVFQ
jgi:beta-glucanase (GH16 family)